MNKLTKIGILDYGTGNIDSLFKALKKVECSPYLIKDNQDLKNSKV